MCCYSFDRISIAIFTDGRLDRESLRLLMDLVGPRIEGRLVLDVGANIGNHAAAFAERAGAVIGFEPHPTTFQLLAMNLAAFPNARAYNVGASNAPARVQAVSPRLNFGGSAISDRAPVEGESVFSFDVVALDSLEEIAAQQVALIKLDVEGHEHEALQGAHGILARDKPVVVLEQNEEAIAGGSSPSVDLLRSVGYAHLYTLDESIPWRTPQALPGPLRKVARFAEAVLFGPPDWTAQILPIERLESRAYPMLIASATPLL
jgi:FkbM family methyltransferase